MFGIQRQPEIPLTIRLDPVIQKNGWNLIQYNNLVCIKKERFYYTLSSMYHFKGRPEPEFDSSLIHLGEYIPAHLDSSMFSALPIVVNNNQFFVNLAKNIVYIKPKDIAIMVPNNSPYNFELYGTFTFAGTYHPCMNSTATSSNTFLSAIPHAPPPKKEKILDTNITTETNSNNVVENTLSDYSYANKPEIPTIQNISYDMSVQRQQKPVVNPSFDMTHYAYMNLETITFLIPFLMPQTTNINSLVKTVLSIIQHVKSYRILLITNANVETIPETIRDNIFIIQHNRYTGRLGQENTLNLKMNNLYDVASFYNYMISSFVKTDWFTVWNYNWEIKKWDSIVKANRIYNVPNYYHIEGQSYLSRQYGRVGYVLNKNMRYASTLDGQDIMVPKLGKESFEQNIIVQGNYDMVDIEDRQNILLYGNEIETRDFFNHIKNGRMIDTVEKIEKIIS
jgi:hypothetical protein